MITAPAIEGPANNLFTTKKSRMHVKY